KRTEARTGFEPACDGFAISSAKTPRTLENTSVAPRPSHDFATHYPAVTQRVADGRTRATLLSVNPWLPARRLPARVSRALTSPPSRMLLRSRMRRSTTPGVCPVSENKTHKRWLSLPRAAEYL